VFVYLYRHHERFRKLASPYIPSFLWLDGSPLYQPLPHNESLFDDAFADDDAQLLDDEEISNFTSNKFPRDEKSTTTKSDGSEHMFPYENIDGGDPQGNVNLESKPRKGADPFDIIGN